MEKNSRGRGHHGRGRGRGANKSDDDDECKFREDEETTEPLPPLRDRVQKKRNCWPYIDNNKTADSQYRPPSVEEDEDEMHTALQLSKITAAEEEEQRLNKMAGEAVRCEDLPDEYRQQIDLGGGDGAYGGDADSVISDDDDDVPVDNKNSTQRFHTSATKPPQAPRVPFLAAKTSAIPKYAPKTTGNKMAADDSRSTTTSVHSNLFTPRGGRINSVSPNLPRRTLAQKKYDDDPDYKPPETKATAARVNVGVSTKPKTFAKATAGASTKPMPPIIEPKIEIEEEAVAAMASAITINNNLDEDMDDLNTRINVWTGKREPIPNCKPLAPVPPPKVSKVNRFLSPHDFGTPDMDFAEKARLWCEYNQEQNRQFNEENMKRGQANNVRRCQYVVYHEDERLGSKPCRDEQDDPLCRWLDRSGALDDGVKQWMKEHRKKMEEQKKEGEEQKKKKEGKVKK